MKHSCDFITDVATGVKFFEDFKSRQKYTFWPQELPNFTRWMKNLGLKWMLVPRWVDGSNFSIEDWVMNMCNKAEASLQEGSQLEPEDVPTVSNGEEDRRRQGVFEAFDVFQDANIHTHRYTVS